MSNHNQNYLYLLFENKGKKFAIECSQIKHCLESLYMDIVENDKNIFGIFKYHDEFINTISFNESFLKLDESLNKDMYILLLEAKNTKYKYALLIEEIISVKKLSNENLQSINQDVLYPFCETIVIYNDENYFVIEISKFIKQHLEKNKHLEIVDHKSAVNE